MGTILTIASQKGGVGKTTTAVNLSYSLAVGGRRVLLFDFDPQGNGTSGVGEASAAAGDGDPGVLSRALSEEPLAQAVRATRYENLWVIPASAELSRLDRIQEAQGRGFKRFRKQVRTTAEGFDFVILDCPPSLGGLPTLALSVSDRVLIPVQCEYYAMEGLSQILPIIQQVRDSKNPRLSIGGLVLTLFAEDLELSRDVAQEITAYFAGRLPGAVLRTIIPRDVVLAEASSHGVPAFFYDPVSRGAWSYIELAKEISAHEWT